MKGRASSILTQSLLSYTAKVQIWVRTRIWSEDGWADEEGKSGGSLFLLRIIFPPSLPPVFSLPLFFLLSVCVLGSTCPSPTTSCFIWCASFSTTCCLISWVTLRRVHSTTTSFCATNQTMTKKADEDHSLNNLPSRSCREGRTAEEGS